MIDTPAPPPNDPEVYLFWMNFFCLVIAAAEIVGGLVGIYDVLFGHSFGSSNPLYGTALAFFLFTFVSGIVLAVNRSWGVFPSLVVQAAQLFQLSTAGLFYHFTCGPEFVVGYTTGDNGVLLASGLGLRAFLSFSAPVSLALNPDAVFQYLPDGAITGINFAALAALICLLLARSAHRSRRSASLTHPVV